MLAFSLPSACDTWIAGPVRVFPQLLSKELLDHIYGATVPPLNLPCHRLPSPCHLLCVHATPRVASDVQTH